MAQKNKVKVDYVNYYYAYGSEAPKLEPVVKTLRERLPQIRLDNIQRIYIDPVAVAGLAVAACMLVLMIMGAFHMRDTRAEYDAMSSYLSELKRENARLSHSYYTNLDLDGIRNQAQRADMKEAEEAERFTVYFSVPEHKEKPSAWDNFVWLISGLLSEPRRPAA